MSKAAPHAGRGRAAPAGAATGRRHGPLPCPQAAALPRPPPPESTQRSPAPHAAASPDADLDPPFLKDDGSPVTLADARAVEAEEARMHGGHVPKGGFASAVQARGTGCGPAPWRATSAPLRWFRGACSAPAAARRPLAALLVQCCLQLACPLPRSCCRAAEGGAGQRGGGVHGPAHPAGELCRRAADGPGCGWALAASEGLAGHGMSRDGNGPTSAPLPWCCAPPIPLPLHAGRGAAQPAGGSGGGGGGARAAGAHAQGRPGQQDDGGPGRGGAASGQAPDPCAIPPLGCLCMQAYTRTTCPPPRRAPPPRRTWR